MGKRKPDNISPNHTSSDDKNNGRLSDKITIIPVIEERVQVGKKVVESGKVHISKSVSEQIESISIPVNHEEVQVERVAVNQYIESHPPPVRHEGDTMIIPVLQEVLVVEKRLLLVEELHITKKQVQTEEVRDIKLRKEEVHITRTPLSDSGTTS